MKQAHIKLLLLYVHVLIYCNLYWSNVPIY